MNPYVMSLLLLLAIGSFARLALRRWHLMTIGPNENRFDHIGERLRRTWNYAFVQKRMRRYPLAGLAHWVIFGGFLVLLLRSIVLFGRGYSEDFTLWGLLAEGTVLGNAYSIVKDIFVVLVIIGAAVFLYYRVVKRLPRMTLSFEGLLILFIILAMMFGDILYDGGHVAKVLAAESGTCPRYQPLGLIAGMALHGVGLGSTAINVLTHVGFWTHVSLVLIFLNLLPVSKHFHIITAIPNVFTQSLAPRGRLPKTEDIEGKLEREETLGLARIDQLSWKGILDLYTCTECGRCSDFCPATKTGKLLSPKHLTLDLRNFLYANEAALTGASGDSGILVGPACRAGPENADGVDADSAFSKGPARQAGPIGDLVPDVINPEVIWACTTCGACETECPVFITYVDKIVDMRRHLVMEKAEFPEELQNAFRGMETNANPWSFPASERGGWTSGLDVPLLRDKPDADILFWVGCSPSFDDRAKKIARAMAQLMKQAGVNFAILGDQEQCTGDPARRAGNEFLFQFLAQANVETLNGMNVKKIVTTCPHCFNTLLNEYPDFGGHYEVVHHTDYLADLIRQGRLTPKNEIKARVVYHDSCYLGRYNEIYDSPREALRAIPGLTVLEPTATRDRGMCCGAGGAQMFKEEEKGTMRVNEARTDQLLETQPDMVVSACPFCQRMLIDGLAGRGRESVRELDVAELLWESVGGA